VSGGDTGPRNYSIQYVVRGGENTPQNFINGSGRVDPPYSNLTGFSVVTAPGMSVEQLAIARSYPNTSISYSTTDALRSVGVKVVPTPFPERGNPLHATGVVQIPLDPALAAKISAMFRQMPNPSKGKCAAKK
jgi:hypothetical protein